MISIINPSILIKDSPAIDSFGKLQTSDPFSLFESKFFKDLRPLEWDTRTVGTGSVTHGGNLACAVLSVSATNDKAVIQTRDYIPYHPGRSLQIIISSNLAVGGALTGVEYELGFGDDTNDKSVDSGGDGFFFRLSGSTFSIVERTFTTGSQVDTVINQSSFSLDKFDGTGPSGLTFDATKANIFVIDMQWLGAGRVRFGLVSNGILHIGHEINHTNLITVPYMRTATLPIRASVKRTSGSGSASLRLICATAICGGYPSLKGQKFSSGTGITTKSVSTTLLPICSLRLKSTHNRGRLFPQSVELLGTAANNFEVSVWTNATLTGAAFASVDTNSISEFDTTASAMSGGQKIQTTYISSQSRGNIITDFENIYVRSNIAGTADIFTLAAKALTGNGPAVGTINWLEFA